MFSGDRNQVKPRAILPCCTSFKCHNAAAVQASKLRISFHWQRLTHGYHFSIAHRTFLFGSPSIWKSDRPINPP
jgi:hypothetical protein